MALKRFVILIIILLAVAFVVWALVNHDGSGAVAESPPSGRSAADTSRTEGSERVATTETSDPDIPRFLRRSFPDTDFSNADPAVADILSGGPPKDGIPALDDPMFVLVDTFAHTSTVQAIVMEHEDTVKVYPYNILNWHEIVNDVVDGRPVAITFCPLCGSAVVYDRTLQNGTTTFGVSGALIESNMVMYDRATESLWQQSTGEALAGAYRGTTLELAPFQLLTMSEVAERYPNALLLSEETGFARDYARNPYSGYETDDEQFFFRVGEFSGAFPAKEIMVVFRVDGLPVATPWNPLLDGTEKTATVGGQELTLRRESGELTITNAAGEKLPFYFEMWFSFAVQHGAAGVVLE